MRLLRLLWGLFLYSLGIVFTLKANIGYAPWEVFHVGFANTAGISIGTASIITGLAVGILSIMLGEKLGLGTILNMVLIGVFLDVILMFKFIPTASNFVFGLIMMFAGMMIISLASYYYIGSGFGAGPRDSLMVALTRKTKLSVGICRGSIELIAVFIGWRLGGMVGLGTIISAFAIGFCIQTTFKLFKFDPAMIQHNTLGQTWRAIFKYKNEEPLKTDIEI
ncbi:MAG: hypothetical protein JJE29_02685 [Peptostreptococcaceae bacterium]|nr:hypothetical protein [Peptostreptococcaceae bacterium]